MSDMTRLTFYDRLTIGGSVFLILSSLNALNVLFVIGLLGWIFFPDDVE